MAHAGLIVKATRLCNLRCTYCHDWRTGPNQTMSFPILAALTRAVLHDPDHASVDFIWHGGETTVLPIAFYQKAILLQEHFRRPGQLVRNVIQTNATRLTPAWARFLKAYSFSVGVSLDGPPDIHDRYRRYASGRPSFDAVLRGIRVLRAHGVPFMALMVIDEEALAAGPDRVFDVFRDLGVNRYSLLSAKPTNQPDAPRGTLTEHYADPERMGRFLARLYDRWREHGDRKIEIRELRAIENRLRGRAAGICTLAGGCMGTYYLIEPNGEVAHCDLFLGDDRYTLGSVVTDSFRTLRSNAQIRALSEENDRALAGMRECPEFSVCNGWCPHERYLSVRHNPSHSEGCCGLRPLIDHVRARFGVHGPLVVRSGMA